MTDTTDKLRQDGSIGWVLTSFKSSWAKRVINEQDLYWIQISLPNMVGTAPTARLITNL